MENAKNDQPTGLTNDEQRRAMTVTTENRVYRLSKVDERGMRTVAVDGQKGRIGSVFQVCVGKSMSFILAGDPGVTHTSIVVSIEFDPDPENTT